MSYSFSILSNSWTVTVLWTQNCRTAPSINRGQPMGMCDSSSASPLFPMIDPSIGPLIVAFRLTCSLLLFQVSPASRPLSASIARSMQSRRLRRLQKRASADLYVVHPTVQVQQIKHKNRKPSKTKNTNHKKQQKVSNVTDRRSSLETRVVKEQISGLRGGLRWVSSDRQLADRLTKDSMRQLRSRYLHLSPECAYFFDAVTAFCFASHRSP